MEKRINVSYICVSKLKGKDDFILLKERFDFKKLLSGSKYPFSYYAMKTNYKTKYNNEDIEEAYDYRGLLNYDRKKKQTKRYILSRGFDRSVNIIKSNPETDIVSKARLK